MFKVLFKCILQYPFLGVYYIELGRRNFNCSISRKVTKFFVNKILLIFKYPVPFLSCFPRYVENIKITN